MLYVGSFARTIFDPRMFAFNLLIVLPFFTSEQNYEFLTAGDNANGKMAITAVLIGVPLEHIGTVTGLMRAGPSTFSSLGPSRGVFAESVAEWVLVVNGKPTSVRPMSLDYTNSSCQPQIISPLNLLHISF